MLNVASYVMHRVDHVDQIDIRFVSFNVLYYVCIQITSMYYGVPRSIVEAFVNMCNVCQQKKSQHNQAPLRPIILHNFLSRLQVSMYNG